MKAGWLVATAALACGAAASAQSLIVRSVGPSRAKYPVGTRLANDASLMLVEGDRVTLLDRYGTREITRQRPVSLWQRREPGRIAALGTDTARAAAARRTPDRNVRVGAVRGTDAVPVQVGAAGAWCINAEQAVRFEGADMHMPAFAIRRADGTTLALGAAGTWSSGLAAGEQVTLIAPAGALTLHALPASVFALSAEEQGEHFANAGCRQSFDRLVARQEALGGWTLAEAPPP